MAIRTYFVILFPGTRLPLDEAMPYNVALSYFHYGTGDFEKTLTLPYLEGRLTLEQAKTAVLKSNAKAQVVQPLKILKRSGSEIYSFVFIVEAEHELRCTPESWSAATHVHDALHMNADCTEVLALADTYLPSIEERYDRFQDMADEAEQLADLGETIEKFDENDWQNPNSERYWEGWWAEKEDEEGDPF